MQAAIHISKPSAYVYDQPKSLLQRFVKAISGHIGLLVCVSVFASLGAYIFIAIETPAEEHRYLVKRLRAKDIEDTMAYVSKLFWFEKNHDNLTERQWENKVHTTLKVMEAQIISAVNEHRYDGHVEDWAYDWTFPKAFLFTCSIMTTLGYGHIVPRTSAGRVFTICYAMIGVPLMLVFLARIGDVMANGFKRVYSRVCCRWCRARRYKSEAVFGKKAKRTWEDEIGQEDYMPTMEVRVPVAVLLVVMLLYLLLGAQIFSSWEGWTFVGACYFSFVTLSTIGFGDFVPGNSFFGQKVGLEPHWRMISAIAYCLLGMAMVSMCIQMVQQQVVDHVRWMGEELGLVEDHLRPRLQYRRSAPGTVPGTRSSARCRRSRSSTVEEVEVVAGEKSRSSRRRKKGSRSPAEEKEGIPTRCRRKKVMGTGSGATADGPTAVSTEADPSCGSEEGDREMELDVDDKAGLKEEAGGRKSVLPTCPEESETEDEEDGERCIEEEMGFDKGIREEVGGWRELKRKTELEELIEEEMDSVA